MISPATKSSPILPGQGAASSLLSSGTWPASTHAWPFLFRSGDPSLREGSSARAAQTVAAPDRSKPLSPSFMHQRRVVNHSHIVQRHKYKVSTQINLVETMQ